MNTNFVGLQIAEGEYSAKNAYESYKQRKFYGFYLKRLAYGAAAGFVWSGLRYWFKNIKNLNVRCTVQFTYNSRDTFLEQSIPKCW